jgi:hypothetical protein
VLAGLLDVLEGFVEFGGVDAGLGADLFAVGEGAPATLGVGGREVVLGLGGEGEEQDEIHEALHHTPARVVAMAWSLETVFQLRVVLVVWRARSKAAAVILDWPMPSG